MCGGAREIGPWVVTTPVSVFHPVKWVDPSARSTARSQGPPTAGGQEMKGKARVVPGGGGCSARHSWAIGSSSAGAQLGHSSKPSSLLLGLLFRCLDCGEPSTGFPGLPIPVDLQTGPAHRRPEAEPSPGGRGRRARAAPVSWCPGTEATCAPKSGCSVSFPA